MKTIILMCVLSLPTLAQADQYVHGYTRGDGTSVGGYWRSDPDGSTYNNYSHRGNYNPYTGQIGTRDD